MTMQPTANNAHSLLGALPKGPVLGWSSFRRVDAPGIPSIEDLPYTAFTTSGRSAIYQALLQMQLPAGSLVLVPSYHCPTMVAPVLLAGHRPAYFAIRPDGLPHLEGIPESLAGTARAMLVSHYFGIAQSLQGVRAWCDARGIALVEDCAHCYFGQAGDRPIGAWGDYSTASLSKFFPVPECGVLASASHPIQRLQLTAQSIKAEVKGCIDVLEVAARHRRLPGLNGLLRFGFSLKQRLARPAPASAGPAPAPADAMMAISDMGRIARRPLGASLAIRRILPRGRVIARRQRNFAIYLELFAGLPGTRPIVMAPVEPVAPYVFPLWVDNADVIYHAMRLEGLPVFRWDRLWPGVPVLPDDTGPLWSRHLIQFLCHQDLSEDDIRRTAGRLIEMLQPGFAHPPAPPSDQGHPP